MEQQPQQHNSDSDEPVMAPAGEAAIGQPTGWDPNEQVGDIYAVTIEPGRDPQIEVVYEGVPEIYVASLADYNAGRYHGAWIDATLDPEEICIRIATMLRHSPVLRAEGETFGDWAIHDYEGFGGIRLGEIEDPGYINAVALGIAEYGDAFAAWVDINGRRNHETRTAWSSSSVTPTSGSTPVSTTTANNSGKRWAGKSWSKPCFRPT